MQREATKQPNGRTSAQNAEPFSVQYPTAAWQEPCELRGAHTVLWEPECEIPSGHLRFPCDTLSDWDGIKRRLEYLHISRNIKQNGCAHTFTIRAHAVGANARNGICCRSYAG